MSNQNMLSFHEYRRLEEQKGVGKFRDEWYKSYGRYCEQQRALAAELRLWEWRPIESAPKVKSPMIVVCGALKSGYVTDPWCVWWQEDAWQRWPHKEAPTHWMPLPSMPAPPTADDLARVLEEGE